MDTLLASAPPVSQASWRQASVDRHRAALSRHGLPSRRQENWKYTALRPLEGIDFQTPVPSSSVLQPEDLAAMLDDIGASTLGSSRLVIVNGQYIQALSYVDDSSGLRMTPLSEVDGAQSHDGHQAWVQNSIATEFTNPDEGFAALNTILATDGVVLEARPVDNATSVVPVVPVVEVLVVDSPEAESPATAVRHLLKVAAGASLTVIERHLSPARGPGLINSVCQLQLEPGASMNHIALPMLGTERSLISRVDVQVGADANYTFTGLDLGGALVRRDLNVAMLGEGGHSALNGVYALGQRSHVDIHCCIDHRVANATSDQRFRGVLRDSSRAVFNGKVVVQEGADGTDASQSNDNLLLSAEAEVDTKPELEIYADDVKCAHGTTVGALSPDHLFYLRARGIPEAEATRLLTTGFCRQVLDAVEPDPLKQQMVSLLEAHLEATQA